MDAVNVPMMRAFVRMRELLTSNASGRTLRARHKPAAWIPTEVGLAARVVECFYEVTRHITPFFIAVRMVDDGHA